MATTKGALGQADAAYTLDTLTLPSDTPGNVVSHYGTRVFPGRPDGVCTHGGDVWIVSGIDAGWPSCNGDGSPPGCTSCSACR